MFKAWRKRRNCFHHDRVNGKSWIEQELIQNGMGKRFWCTSCQRQWFV